jgi:hypothetical protein
MKRPYEKSLLFLHPLGSFPIFSMYPPIIVTLYRHGDKRTGFSPSIENDGARKIIVAFRYGDGIVLAPKIADMRTDQMYVHMRILIFQVRIKRIGIVPAKPFAFDADVDEEVVHVRRTFACEALFETMGERNGVGGETSALVKRYFGETPCKQHTQLRFVIEERLRRSASAKEPKRRR